MVYVHEPPPPEEIGRDLPVETTRRLAALIAQRRLGPTVGGRYLHWDDLRRREAPAGLDHRSWWFGIKMARALLQRELPLRDNRGRPLHVVATVEPVIDLLHRIDVRSGMLVSHGKQVIDPEERDAYLYRSLRHEGVESSILEGAATTRREALAMLEENRRPRTPGERMVLNNYWALERVRLWKDAPLTRDKSLELHALITRDTLDDPAASGRLRRPGTDDDVVVSDAAGHVLYRPPPAEELPARLRRFLAFANRETESARPYLHPVVHAVLLHLQFALDHPFVDGNGRVARALFYWALARHGYHACEYVSISAYVRRARARYLRAFLLTETDAADATYFLLHQLAILDRALGDLEKYVEERKRRIHRLERLLGESGLNHRQLDLLSAALQDPGARFTIAGHRKRHGVVYQTARKDLLDLVRRGLLVQLRIGRKFVFHPASGLGRRVGIG